MEVRNEITYYRTYISYHLRCFLSGMVVLRILSWIQGFSCDRYAKMTQNEAKYPVEKARGSAAKYDQLTDDKKTEG